MIAEFAVRLARMVRPGHHSLGADRSGLLLQALQSVDLTQRAEVYWAGRLTLCVEHDDIARYDRAFDQVFSATSLQRNRMSTVEIAKAAPFSLELPMGAAGDDSTPGTGITASRAERLRHLDFAAVTAADRAAIDAMIAALRPRTPHRQTRRWKTNRAGRIDAQRTTRAMLRMAGEPTTLIRKQHQRTPRRLLFLIDVSGSMSAYAEAMLRMAHAGVQAQPGRVEVFTLGTRLTRLTRELRIRNPAGALHAAGRALPDWSGGTRLGETLQAFLDLWGQRGTARGAVTVICSDGWERGDVTLLDEQVARLSRLSNSLLWVNPHRGKDGFTPSTAGMAAAVPHLNELVAGHDIAALDDLCRRITARL